MKYPKIVVDCIEEAPVRHNGYITTSNMDDPNPNKIEFDNLYASLSYFSLKHD